MECLLVIKITLVNKLTILCFLGFEGEQKNKKFPSKKALPCFASQDLKGKKKNTSKQVQSYFAFLDLKGRYENHFSNHALCQMSKDLNLVEDNKSKSPK